MNNEKPLVVDIDMTKQGDYDYYESDVATITFPKTTDGLLDQRTSVQDLLFDIYKQYGEKFIKDTLKEAKNTID